MVRACQNSLTPSRVENGPYFVTVGRYYTAVGDSAVRYAPPDLSDERHTAEQPEWLSWETGGTESGGNHRQDAHGRIEARVDASFTPYNVSGPLTKCKPACSWDC